jgi:hypothetical protein
MGKLAVVLLSLLAALPALASMHGCAGCITYPTFALYFAGSMRNPTLSNFLALGKQQGVDIIGGGSNPQIEGIARLPITDDYGAVHAAGYQHIGGVGYDAPACALNDPAFCNGYLAHGLAGVMKEIENQLSYKPSANCASGSCNGATFIMIDEPCWRVGDNSPVGHHTAYASRLTGATSIQVNGPLPSWIQTALTQRWPVKVGDQTTKGGSGADLGYIASVSGSNPFTITFTRPISANVISGDNLIVSDLCSIPYLATGIGIIEDYIRSHGWNVKFGISAPRTPQNFLDLFTWAQNNGVTLTDFVQSEDYNSSAENSSPSDIWGAFHATFPKVLRSDLFVGVDTFCSALHADPALSPSQIDIIGFYGADAYWDNGPASFLNAPSVAAAVGASKDKVASCNTTFANAQNTGWNTRYQSFTWNITDWPYWGWQIGGSSQVAHGTTPPAVTSCEYQVYSGSMAQNGILDPTVVQTYPDTTGTLNWATGQTHLWASRLCGTGAYPGTSMPLITVGAGENCRHEVVQKFNGYVRPDGNGTTSTLTITDAPSSFIHSANRWVGPPTPLVAYPNLGGTILFGSGVPLGTALTAQLSGTTGEIGIYTVTGSFTVGSAGRPVALTGRLGWMTCLIVVRNHNTQRVSDVQVIETNVAF